MPVAALLRLKTPAFQNGICVYVCACQVASVVSNSATPWTVAHQSPLCMGFSRQEYRSGLPCPPPGIFLTQGSNHGGSPALQADSLLLSHTGSDCLQFHVTELHILGLHLLLPRRADPLTSLSEGIVGLQVLHKWPATQTQGMDVSGDICACTDSTRGSWSSVTKA